MSKQIRNLGVFLAVCYVALFLQVNRLTVFEAEALQDKPAEHPGDRARLLEPPRRHRQRRRRGAGRVGAVRRPLRAAAHLPDRDRRAVRPHHRLLRLLARLDRGRARVQRLPQRRRHRLRPRPARRPVRRPRRRRRRHPVGAQRRAAGGPRRSSATSPGSVVALDPRNGEILAMWSSATYDPNLLATHDFAAAAGRSPRRYNADPAKPTPSRAFHEREFFPGSTFKVVTATAGIERGGVTADAARLPASPTATSRRAAAGRSPTSAASSCGGTLFVILQKLVQHARSPRWASTWGATTSTRPPQGFGFDRDVPFDLPGGVQSNFPEEIVDDPPARRPGLDRPERRAGHTAADGAGGGGGGQRRRDHGAPRHARGARRPGQQGRGVRRRATSPRPMSPPTAGHAARGDGLGRHRRHGQPARRRARRLRGRRQDRHGPARHRPARSRTRGSSASPGPPGETPHVAVAVIVEAQPGASEQTGGQVAAPIAAAVMQRALASPADGPGRPGRQQDGDSGDGG